MMGVVRWGEKAGGHESEGGRRQGMSACPGLGAEDGAAHIRDSGDLEG